VSSSTLDKHLARRQPGEALKIHAFRRDELMSFDVKLDPPTADTAKLIVETRRKPAKDKALQTYPL
jgi:predicted metalloprotease with PDZ domain